jgi:hypothetical protein
MGGSDFQDVWTNKAFVAALLSASTESIFKHAAIWHIAVCLFLLPLSRASCDRASIYYCHHQSVQTDLACLGLLYDVVLKYRFILSERLSAVKLKGKHKIETFSSMN